MPIYEYRCSECGFEKDALQKMSDPPLVDCPNCGKPALVKLVSAAGFQLKGSGWYVTDFKSSGTKAPAGKAATKDADGGGEAKSGGEGDKAKNADSGSGESKSGESKPAESKPADKPASSASPKPTPSGTGG
jgi:putative FmdB family regulatory protein